jgi:hypothetical protein
MHMARRAAAWAAAWAEWTCDIRPLQAKPDGVVVFREQRPALRARHNRSPPPAQLIESGGCCLPSCLFARGPGYCCTYCCGFSFQASELKIAHFDEARAARLVARVATSAPRAPAPYEGPPVEASAGCGCSGDR